MIKNEEYLEYSFELYNENNDFIAEYTGYDDLGAAERRAKELLKIYEASFKVVIFQHYHKIRAINEFRNGQ